MSSLSIAKQNVSIINYLYTLKSSTLHILSNRYSYRFFFVVGDILVILLYCSFNCKYFFGVLFSGKFCLIILFLGGILLLLIKFKGSDFGYPMKTINKCQLNVSYNLHRK